MVDTTMHNQTRGPLISLQVRLLISVDQLIGSDVIAL